MSDVKAKAEQLKNIMKKLGDPATEFLKTGLALLNSDSEESAYNWEFFLEGANMGDPDAMYELGMCYRWGNGGVYANPSEALSWFKKAAELGNEKAQSIVESFDSPSGKNILLMSAMNGIEGPGSKWYNVEEAVDLYRKQALEGNAESQYELARQLSNPKRYGPFKYDIQEAIRWYTEAGNSGMIDAMFNLASIYFNGAEGQPIDKEKAREWFQKCSDAGDREAREILETPSKWED